LDLILPIIYIETPTMTRDEGRGPDSPVRGVFLRNSHAADNPNDVRAKASPSGEAPFFSPADLSPGGSNNQHPPEMTVSALSNVPIVIESATPAAPELTVLRQRLPPGHDRFSNA
jgi:hypothetical protein